MTTKLKPSATTFSMITFLHSSVGEVGRSADSNQAPLVGAELLPGPLVSWRVGLDGTSWKVSAGETAPGIA